VFVCIGFDVCVCGVVIVRCEFECGCVPVWECGCAWVFVVGCEV
jgi:hypothetical protein